MPLRHLIVLIANIHLLVLSCAKQHYKYQQKDQFLEIYSMARLSFQSSCRGFEHSSTTQCIFSNWLWRTSRSSLTQDANTIKCQNNCPNISSLYDFNRTGKHLFHTKQSSQTCFSLDDASPNVSTKYWWSQTGSNRRPPACKAGALPAELWPLILFIYSHPFEFTAILHANSKQWAQYGGPGRTWTSDLTLIKRAL